MLRDRARTSNRRLPDLARAFVDGTDGLLVIALYVVAVCGSLLVSGYRNVVLFGVVNLVAVIVITRLTISGFASVWCGWAAVSSAAITLHCRLARPRPLRGGSGPGRLMSVG